MRVLILFTAESIEKQQAYPGRLRELLQACDASLAVDVAIYDDLDYRLSQDNMQITVNSTGRSLDEYDVVYLRRIKEGIAQAIAVGKYCLHKGISVIDSEIAARPGSMGKLTQYVQFAIAGLPFPETVYAAPHNLLLKAFDRHPLKFPVIVKSVSGSRGQDNHLVHTHEEMVGILRDNPRLHFLIQAFVPNTSDYRVWVCGDQVGPILYRSRQSGHTNNTSQGGQAKLLQDTTALPGNVLNDCVRAARFLERDVAGVDVVFENDDTNGTFYFFEVNRAPQIEHTPYEDEKAHALAVYITKQAKKRGKA